MDGHVSDGARKEGCWECSKVSEHPRGPGSGRALSAQGAGTTASAGSQLLVLQWRVPGRMGRELALESRSPRALRPGLDLTGAAPLSFAPAGTRVPPEHKCARHRLPRTRVCGSATPFPLPGCAGPDPRLHSVHGRTPPLHPRVWHMEQSLCGSPVAPCEGWPHEDRGGVGCAPLPFPHPHAFWVGDGAEACTEVALCILSLEDR